MGYVAGISCQDFRLYCQRRSGLQQRILGELLWTGREYGRGLPSRHLRELHLDDLLPQLLQILLLLFVQLVEGEFARLVPAQCCLYGRWYGLIGRLELITLIKV